MISRPIDGSACTCLMKAIIDNVAAEGSICGPSNVISLAVVTVVPSRGTRTGPKAKIPVGEQGIAMASLNAKARRNHTQG